MFGIADRNFTTQTHTFFRLKIHNQVLFSLAQMLIGILFQARSSWI